jgi:hypothetical protein
LPAKKQQIGDEERSENFLVVPCQPFRQIDVEIRAAVVCVAARKISDRATPSIDGQYHALDENASNKHRDQRKTSKRRGNRDERNASDKEEPHRSVQTFEGYKSAALIW